VKTCGPNDRPTAGEARDLQEWLESPFDLAERIQQLLKTDDRKSPQVSAEKTETRTTSGCAKWDDSVDFPGKHKRETDTAAENAGKNSQLFTMCNLTSSTPATIQREKVGPISERSPSKRRRRLKNLRYHSTVRSSFPWLYFSSQ
jgi:hypothetical protein